MRNLILINKLVNNLNITTRCCILSTPKFVQTCLRSHNNIAKISNFSNLSIPNNQNQIVEQKWTIRCFSLSQCSYAKNRDKGKEKKKKGGSVMTIDENEMGEVMNIERYKKDLDFALEALKNDLIKNINVRSSTGSIEELKVKMDDKTYTIQELAQVARKPKLVVINCATFPQATKSILDALNSSAMNLNPQIEGTTIYVPTPKVTKEHREQLAKNAKALLTKHKDNMKNLQNKQLKTVKDKDKVEKDLAHRVQEMVKAMFQKYCSEAEKFVEMKQKEVLGE